MIVAWVGFILLFFMSSLSLVSAQRTLCPLAKGLFNVLGVLYAFVGLLWSMYYFPAK